MKNSLRVKFKILITLLISVNAVIVIISLYNFFYIKDSINSFYKYNFDSINAVKNMQDITENQHFALLNYISTKNETYKNNFLDLDKNFYDNYAIQLDRTSENGELDLNNQTKALYIKFFNTGKTTFDSYDKGNSISGYYNEIQNKYNELKQNLDAIYELNNNAMKVKILNSQEKIILSSKFLFISSLIVLFLSILLSNKYLDKLLLPLVNLQNAIRGFKDGNFSFNRPINSEDEIGEIYKEFHNMSKRIKEFKDSTLGQLMEEKNKSLSIVKSISNPLIVLDNNFKCILINDACEDFFKFREASLIGQHILDFITDGDLFDFISKAKEVNFSGASKVMNFHKDSHSFNVSVSTIKNRDSNLNGIIVYFQDITELKKLDKLKQDFISTLSHELKTPLTSIMMGSSMLEESVIIENADERYRIINTIQEDAENLLNMIDNFLKLTQLETDQNYLNFEIADISDIIKNSIKNFCTISHARNIILNFERIGALPMISIDKEKFSWVVNNLISNSIKYSLDNKQVFISLYSDDKSIILTVQDQGIGISKSQIDKIFDKFYRGNDTSNGTGLGLPLSKQIVELHNGTITCNSVYGSGSIFKVTLPIIGGI
ncbi:ATP-binding protein [Clostridium paridis]|uniref:histidine kinase n=1 Tax=Clostridium paridis TaxID=2803863 RepID=A0A937FGB2_9CLOT|nr:ATP-binding protein [Clostridium paridis]MBL4932425.1 PAS domain S-box protein [Clostridium paridis]